MRPLISRRAALRAAGACVALPWLESLAWADEPAAVPKPPVRLGFFAIQSGVNMVDWTPGEAGMAAERSAESHGSGAGGGHAGSSEPDPVRGLAHALELGEAGNVDHRTRPLHPVLEPREAVG